MGGGRDAITSASLVAIAVAIAIRVARHLAAIRALALRAHGTWCVGTPFARFKHGDYDGARAIVNAARHVRIVTV